MKYRIYDCTVQWKTNDGDTNIGDTAFVRIATGDDEARNCEDIDDQVFHWSDDEPTVGQDLGGCTVKEVRLGLTKYEVRYISTIYVTAFSEEDAIERAEVIWPTVAGTDDERFYNEVKELGDE